MSDYIHCFNRELPKAILHCYRRYMYEYTNMYFYAYTFHCTTKSPCVCTMVLCVCVCVCVCTLIIKIDKRDFAPLSITVADFNHERVTIDFPILADSQS